MSILKVARMGQPVLRKKARALDPTEIRTAAFQKLVDDMIETMHEYLGIGLAGPQVHEDVRLFASIEDDAGELRVMPFINPEVTPTGTVVEEDWDGCLSIPDIRGIVPRSRDIVVRGLDRRGKPMEMALSGFRKRWSRSATSSPTRTSSRSRRATTTSASGRPRRRCSLG